MDYHRNVPSKISSSSEETFWNQPFSSVLFPDMLSWLLQTYLIPKSLFRGGPETGQDDDNDQGNNDTITIIAKVYRDTALGNVYIHLKRDGDFWPRWRCR